MAEQLQAEKGEGPPFSQVEVEDEGPALWRSGLSCHPPRTHVMSLVLVLAARVLIQLPANVQVKYWAPAPT